MFLKSTDYFQEDTQNIYATDCETYNCLLNIVRIFCFFNFCIAYCTSSILELKTVFSKVLLALNNKKFVSVQWGCLSIDFQLNWQNDHFCCVSWLVLANTDDQLSPLLYLFNQKLNLSSIRGVGAAAFYWFYISFLSL